ncbi:MAG: alkaline phosphatase family protein [Chloroflexi bacterium]|nr:alkaline phosphatase family protein [Chloroflexota bacterium]
MSNEAHVRPNGRTAQPQLLVRRTVIFVWDGLRPDSIEEEITPAAADLARRGVRFTRSHCVFPSETRVNAAALSTGAYPPIHGIVGNTLFIREVDAIRGLNTGDRAVLDTIDRISGPLVQTECMADRVCAVGGSVAVVASGGDGSSFLANPLAGSHPRTILINRKVVNPPGLAEIVRHRFGPVPPHPERPDPEPALAQNAWAARVLTEYILPELQPTVTICWFRDPDTSQHYQGIGSPAALRALQANDRHLARTIETLDRLGLSSATNVFLTSDHGFSTVVPRAGGSVAAGLVAAGLKQTADSPDVVVGDGTIHLSSSAAARAGTIVAYLQGQAWMGNVFVRDNGPAAGLPGTLPLSALWDGHVHQRCPDIQYSVSWSDVANAAGICGASLGVGASAASHGTTSPYDLRNTLIAAGPDFRVGVESDFPCGIVDIAPTVLWTLGLDGLPRATGRILHEALRVGPTGAAMRADMRELAAETGLPSGVYRQQLRVVRVGSTVYVDRGWAEGPGYSPLVRK